MVVFITISGIELLKPLEFIFCCVNEVGFFKVPKAGG